MIMKQASLLMTHLVLALHVLLRLHSSKCALRYYSSTVLDRPAFPVSLSDRRFC